MVEEIEKIQEKIEKGIAKQEARVEKVTIKKQAQVEKGMVKEALKKRLKKLKKIKGISIKQKKAEAIRAAITRRKLLQAIVSKQREGRPVNILRRVSDTIPNVLVKTRAEEIKPTFMGKGRLL